jgi:UDP-N-acetylglucosamine:LPS N-acetylglucosamine transferase
MRICLASSAGGHLTEALEIGRGIDGEKFFVTFHSPHLKDTLREWEYYVITDPRRNPIRLMKAFLQSLKLLLIKRPDVVISTGAGVTVPICYLGKMFGARIIYVECGCRVTKPSIGARIIYPIADLFIVRWKPLLKYFKRAKYGESL